ncbi:phosphatase PAP2 family protein [Bordetella sp. LUAb4]|uniref:phosphatase PAP2 family protein n=1 Tax=Bordetella sp. LUAb4 TaxID=2843195 RepID=UPI001E4E899A|nr:phosphatase PAP2 family protein [Bordetella sp. LUAb4]
MHSFWVFLSAIGESRLLVPAAVLATLFLVTSERVTVFKWACAFAIAALVVLISKLAFLGWGYGWEAIDFTGFSGHSMVSAAIYPVLGYALGNVHSERSARWGAAVGALLAVLIGISRLYLHAHSPSEVVLGLLVGGIASSVVLLKWPAHRSGLRVGAVALGFLLSAIASYGVAPKARAHDLVVVMALKLSGSQQPYTREALNWKPLTW